MGCNGQCGCEVGGKCCKLLRGPKTVIVKTQGNGNSLNFNVDGKPQFDPISVEDGERAIEIYECLNVEGYKRAHIIVVACPNE